MDQEFHNIRSTFNFSGFVQHKESEYIIWSIPTEQSGDFNFGEMFTDKFEQRHTKTSPNFGYVATPVNWFAQVNMSYYEVQPGKEYCTRYISVFLSRRKEGFYSYFNDYSPLLVNCIIQIVDDKDNILTERRTGLESYIGGQRTGWRKFALFDSVKDQKNLKLRITFNAIYNDRKRKVTHFVQETSVNQDTRKIFIVCKKQTVFELYKQQVDECWPNLLDILKDISGILRTDEDGNLILKLFTENPETIGQVVEFIKTKKCEVIENGNEIACDELIKFSSKYNFDPLREYVFKSICRFVTPLNVVGSICTMINLKNICNVQPDPIVKKCLVESLTESAITLIENKQIEQLDSTELLCFLFMD